MGAIRTHLSKMSSEENKRMALFCQRITKSATRDVLHCLSKCNHAETWFRTLFLSRSQTVPDHQQKKNTKKSLCHITRITRRFIWPLGQTTHGRWAPIGVLSGFAIVDRPIMVGTIIQCSLFLTLEAGSDPLEFIFFIIIRSFIGYPSVRLRVPLNHHSTSSFASMTNIRMKQWCAMQWINPIAAWNRVVGANQERAPPTRTIIFEHLSTLVIQ